LYYNFKLDGDLMKYSVGQRLRQARIERGLDCETVAARTKISLRFLNAIEADDRSAFPSGFFYKSFVDQYARALELDTAEIDAEVNDLLSADAPLPLPGRHDGALCLAGRAGGRAGGLFGILCLVAQNARGWTAARRAARGGRTNQSRAADPTKCAGRRTSRRIH
jgi:transcriptional regulator with XRE-family HTH domain